MTAISHLCTLTCDLILSLFLTLPVGFVDFSRGSGFNRGGFRDIDDK